MKRKRHADVSTKVFINFKRARILFIIKTKVSTRVIINKIKDKNTLCAKTMYTHFKSNGLGLKILVASRTAITKKSY